MTKIRGSMFNNIRGYFQHNYPKIYSQIMNELDPESKELFSSVFIYKQFYEFRILQEFLTAFSQKVSHEEYIQSAEVIAERDLKGIFLIIARILSKETLINRMSSMFSKFYDTGSIELISTDEQSTGVRTLGLAYNEIHRVFVEYYMKTILERATKQVYTSQSTTIDSSTTEFWYHMKQK